MPIVSLELKASELEKFYAKWSDSYPRKFSLIIEARYGATLRINNESIGYDDNFYIITHSEGYIRLSNGNISVKISSRVDKNWFSGGKDFTIRVISEPLSLDELYEIENKLGNRDKYIISWHVDCYGFLENPNKYNIHQSTPIRITLGNYGKNFRIGRLDFIKNVLEKADMLKREFIEVIVESVDREFIDRITDSDIREALRILVEKQEFLYNALKQLQKATNSSEYSGVIVEVRKAVEDLTKNTPAGAKLDNALRKAYRLLNIAEDIDQGASEELIDELIATLIGVGNNRGFMKNIFKYCSKLGPHAETEKKKFCKPHPHKYDAEFAIQQAMSIFNYLIKLLRHAAEKI